MLGERDYEFAEKDDYTILNTVIVTGRKYQNGEVIEFEECLGYIVRELLNDDMWEQDYNEVGRETYEVYDFVEHYDI